MGYLVKLRRCMPPLNFRRVPLTNYRIKVGISTGVVQAVMV